MDFQSVLTVGTPEANSSAHGAAGLAEKSVADSVRHLDDFPVVELRRYTIHDGKRDDFARYFESFFPEAFEQLGALALGQFFERDDSTRFTWLRGFHGFEDRPVVNGAFYDGPPWREHRAAMNAMIADSDDVLLLQSRPERSIAVLPAVDPRREDPGSGTVIAQIFPVKAESLEEFTRQADAAFDAYHAAGAQEAGLLATLDAPNNFPRHPVRSDGPFLVWIGIVPDDDAAENGLRPLAERAARELAATGLLRGEPEFVALHPTRRSRLRWVSERDED
jgi:hypothetical protein